MRVETGSEAETERVGEELARRLGGGDVVGLCGPLGVGKTAFVRGLARGLGVAEGAVRSPSFTTAAEYRGRLPVVHIDLYRHERGLPDADWLAELLDGEGVALVEWFERLGAEAPERALLVRIEFGDRADARRIEITDARGAIERREPAELA